MAATDDRKVLDCYDQVTESIDQLVQMLQSMKRVNRKSRSQIAKGLTVQEVFSAIPTGELRKSLTQAMAEVEEGRHEVRRLLFARGLKEGMSIGDLGRMWGFSRQLAARYAKEARGD